MDRLPVTARGATDARNLHGDEVSPSLPPSTSGSAGVPGLLSVSTTRRPGDPGCVPQASCLPRAVQAPVAADGGDGRATGSDAGGRSTPSSRPQRTGPAGHTSVDVLVQLVGNGLRPGRHRVAIVVRRLIEILVRPMEHRG